MAISANAGEYKSRIGLDSLYVALVTVDSSTGYTAGTPEIFAPAAEASQEVANNLETQYADDAPYDVMFAEGETVINLSVTNLPLEMLALITGRVFDSATGQVWDNAATPPEMALGFRSLKSNGGYRYYWFLKGRFSVPNEEAATRGDTPDPKNLTLQFTAIKTTYQFDLGSINGGVKRVVGDTDTTNFSATGWFSQVITPAASTPAALALSSSVPTDGATSVSVSADQSLTFNNSLPASSINNVVLVKASDGSKPSQTVTIDTARKVITINPASSLSASTAYIIAYAVVDDYGQTLSGAVDFTTA